MDRGKVRRGRKATRYASKRIDEAMKRDKNRGSLPAHKPKVLEPIPFARPFPTLNLKLHKKGFNRLTLHEKRRNDYIEFENNLRNQRQAYGRHEHAMRVNAAIKMQSAYRMRQGRMSVTRLAEETAKRKREEEEARLKAIEDAKRQAAADALFEKVDTLVDSPLKTILKDLKTIDQAFTLDLNGWGGQMDDILLSLAAFTSARKIQFSKCVVRNKKKSYDDSRKMAQALVKQRNLQELRIQDCGLNDYDFEHVLGAVNFAAYKTLRKLSITNNFLGRGMWNGADEHGKPTYENRKEGSTMLSTTFRTMSKLSHVDLSYNWMGPYAFNAMISNHAFAKPKTNLVSANLAHNKLGTRGAYSLSHFICACPALNELDISGNGFGVNGLFTVEKSLALHKSLKYLKIANNNLGDRGSIVVGEILRVNTSIVSLDVSQNQFTEEGFTQIASAIISLGSRNHIQHLVLSRNRLGDKFDSAKLQALEVLSRLFESTKTLRCLEMQHINLVTDPKAIPVHRNEETRHFYAPVSVLTNGLKENNTLEVLDLRNNWILGSKTERKKAGKVILNDIIKRRPGLYIPKLKQHLIAAIFKKHLQENHQEFDDSSSIEAIQYRESRMKIADVILRILAFVAEQRRILV